MLSARLFPFCLVLLISASRTQAQAIASPTQAQSPEKVITLEPFQVVTDSNTGYGAQSSNSSSRLNLAYIDIPQTVNVVTAEFLSDTFTTDSRDFSKYITGVTPRTNTHQAETYFIRGLQTTTSYIDGFLSVRAVNRDSGLYDRVEYVKGPASASMGRGEAGGLVNFVPKKPRGGRALFLRTAVGTDNFYRGEIDWSDNILANGKLSYRIPLFFEDADGPRGGALMHTRKYGVGPSMLWRPFSKTEVVVTTSFFNNTTPGAVASAHWMQQDLVDMRVDQNGINPNIWYPGPNTPLVPAENVYAFDDNFKEAKVMEGSVIINQKITDNLSFRQGFRAEQVKQNIVRYNTPPAVARNAAMPSGYQITMTLVRNYNLDEGFRSQSDLLYEFEWRNTRHTFLAGLDAYWEYGTGKSGQRGNLFLDLYRKDPPKPAGYDYRTWVAIDNNSHGENESEGHGYYGQYFGTYFANRLQVMAAWRKDLTKTHSRNIRAGAQNYGNWNEQVTDVPRYSISYKPVSWMTAYYVHSEQADPIAIRNKWSPDVLLNGATSYNDGRRPETDRLTSQVTGFLDEYGIKANLLGGRVTGSVAYYETGRNGFVQNESRSEVGANGLGLISFSENYVADGEKSSGIEVELFGQVTNRLTFVFSAVDAKGTNPRANGVIQPIDALFDEISFNGKYSLRDSNRNGFEIYGGGKHWFAGWTISNGSFKKFNDGQTIYNGGIAYYWRSGRHNVRLYGSNLANDVIFITENSQYSPRRLFLAFSANF